MPFLGMVFIAMAILYIFPDVVFWLPSVFYGR
jgi:TRAP-type mannitol/chloroaromatic compound transport system permease large subunit